MLGGSCRVARGRNHVSTSHPGVKELMRKQLAHAALKTKVMWISAGLRTEHMPGIRRTTPPG